MEERRQQEHHLYQDIVEIDQLDGLKMMPAIPPPKRGGGLRLCMANQLKELLTYILAHVMSGGSEADFSAAPTPIYVEDPEWMTASLVSATLG